MSDPIDQQVLATQKWVNATFKGVAGYVACAEDGHTGQATVNSLIMGLQNVLGISPVVANFGAGTLAALQKLGTISTSTTNTKMITLLQGTLYCKGYDGDSLSGSWADGDTVTGIKSVQTDLGVTTSGTVDAKLFKQILTTDALKLLPGGTANVRAAQQWLNKTFISHTNFFYGSTDGIFDRVTQTNLVFGIQFGLGQSDSSADGAYGPTTASQLKASTSAVVKVGSSDSTLNWVRLFKAALNFNGYAVPFNGTFTASDSAVVKTFQTFEGFTGTQISGIGDFTTWAELLVSTGDASRPGTGADMASTITAARASALVAAGYKVVGRYLTNEQVASPLDKNIKPGELATIFGAGLKLFPIFEEGGYQLSWFTNSQGIADALRALQAAQGYGISLGTVIYFAVDVDAQQTDIDAQIVPYFRGVQSAFAANGYQYSVGVYGSRNVCSVVSSHGLARYSFVGGLSTGWSGNLGFPLPANWSFNQIQSLTVGTGTGAVSIDKNIVSGRDPGISSVNTPGSPNSAFFGWLDALQSLADAWSSSGQGLNLSASTLVLQYMRNPNYGKGGKDTPSGTLGPISWDVVAGVTDVDFVASVEATGLTRIVSYVDPAQSAIALDPQHFAAACNAVTFHGLNSDNTVNLGDAGGWAGDFLSTLADWLNPKDNPDNLSAKDFGKLAIGNKKEQFRYPYDDYVEDVDGLLIGLLVRANPGTPINDIIRQFYSPGGGYATRFSDMKTKRYGNSDTVLMTEATNVFTQTSDSAYALFRAALVVEVFKVDPSSYSSMDVTGLATAYTTVLDGFISNQ
jgi:peptidoglycan hydrolase-like protein with peptidoglycan-binding domain